MSYDDLDIVERLATRFDPQIVFPDELSREAAQVIIDLRKELAEVLGLCKEAREFINHGKTYGVYLPPAEPEISKKLEVAYQKDRGGLVCGD